MDTTNKNTPQEKPEVSTEIEDDFDESLGERQPDANDAIVCEGGCQ